jgi:phage host-nuclease inhibitor protein Gam
MPVEDADALFADIAKLELEIVKIKAAGDLEVAKVTAKYELKIAELAPVLQEKSNTLTSYIQANPERFIKPRARKTPFGTYGMGKVSNLEIVNEELILKYAKDNELPQLYETKTKIEKAAVKKMIEDGFSIPGATINKGERVRITISQDLMDQAKQTIVSL